VLMSGDDLSMVWCRPTAVV